MDTVHWAGSVKYLEVHINGGKNLSFDIHTFRRLFYAAFNNIHSHAKDLEETIQLALFERYCLPLLPFAAGALTYNKQQIHDLNVCWNTMYRAVFNFNRCESLKCFINGLGKLSLQYILTLCKVKFYFLYYTLVTVCFRICFGCTMVTIVLQTIVYVVCLAHDLRPLMLCTSSLKLTVHHSRLCCVFTFFLVYNFSVVFDE